MKITRESKFLVLGFVHHPCTDVPSKSQIISEPKVGFHISDGWSSLRILETRNPLVIEDIKLGQVFGIDEK